MNKYAKLLISIVIPLSIGFLGSFFTTTGEGSWYSQINKPVFNPPNFLFGPVWTTLFVLIGISFYLIWQKGFGKDKKFLIGIFGLQLLLNFLWSFFFFGLENPLIALFDIFLLIAAIIINIIIYYRKQKLSGILLIPYLLWVCFATLLNYAIYILN